MDSPTHTLGILAAWIRRTVVRIAPGLADRLATTDLTRRERAWIVEDVKEDLAVQIDDAELRSISVSGHGRCGSPIMLNQDLRVGA